VSRAAPPRQADPVALRLLQAALAHRLVTRDAFPRPLRSIAGFAVAPDAAGATVRAAAVLLAADTLALIDQQVACLPAPLPRLPGLRGFRDLPALREALARLRQRPDLAFVLGHGIDHPRRLGIAAHFGLEAGLPSIGVAEDVLLGDARIPLHDMRGAFTPLRDGARQVGWLLRSRAGAPPLVVSPGHRVALASAPELAMRFVAAARLPEPLRLAIQLADGGGPATGDEPATPHSRPLHPDPG